MVEKRQVLPALAGGDCFQPLKLRQVGGYRAGFAFENFLPQISIETLLRPAGQIIDSAFALLAAE